MSAGRAATSTSSAEFPPTTDPASSRPSSRCLLVAGEYLVDCSTHALAPGGVFIVYRQHYASLALTRHRSAGQTWQEYASSVHFACSPLCCRQGKSRPDFQRVCSRWCPHFFSFLFFFSFSFLFLAVKSLLSILSLTPLAGLQQEGLVAIG